MNRTPEGATEHPLLGMPWRDVVTTAVLAVATAAVFVLVAVPATRPHVQAFDDSFRHRMIELRSGREGHPSYRAVAHEMHAQIAEVHPGIARAMIHVDRETEPRLERILAELRNS